MVPISKLSSERSPPVSSGSASMEMTEQTFGTIARDDVD
jgi:hypothetical protein